MKVTGTITFTVNPTEVLDEGIEQWLAYQPIHTFDYSDYGWELVSKDELRICVVLG